MIDPTLALLDSQFLNSCTSVLLNPEFSLLIRIILAPGS